MDGAWRATGDERRQAVSAALQVASAFVGGSLAPLVVWGLEYVFDRRDLIFDRLGAPDRAYTSERAPVPLRTADASTLSINTPLSDAARRLGLRHGDPVGVVVSGHRYVRDRSGLVVPTRIGERVDVSVPAGDYSLAAFGGRRDTLFRATDPYTAVAGGNVAVAGRRRFDLALAARDAVAPATPLLLPRQLSAPYPRTCLWCGTRVQNLLLHANFCPKRTFYCGRCGTHRRSAADLENHRADAHPTFWERFFRLLDDL